MNPDSLSPQTENKESGAFIGSLIIVLILLALGTYFLFNALAENKEQTAEAQKIHQENEQNAILLESIEQQLSVPEPDYVGGLNTNSQTMQNQTLQTTTSLSNNIK